MFYFCKVISQGKPSNKPQPIKSWRYLNHCMGFLDAGLENQVKENSPSVVMYIHI